MKVVRFIFKSFLIIVGLATTTLLGLFAYIYYNQDKIKGVIIDNLNENINTPVDVADIGFDFFQKFPYVSLKFSNITMRGSKTTESSTLLAADQVLLTFNILDFINQKYEIKKVYFNDAVITMIVDENGDINYDIVKKNHQKSSSEKTNSIIDLRSIHLNNVSFQYLNLQDKQDYEVLIYDADGGFKSEGDIIASHILGSTLLKHVKQNGNKYVEDKALNLKLTLFLDTKKKVMTIHDTEIKLNETKLKAKGKYIFDDKPFIDLYITTAESKVNTLLSLMPQKIYNKLKTYNSSGEVYFIAKILGEINDSLNPNVNVTFGLREISLNDTKNSVSVKKLNMRGSFSTIENGAVDIDEFNCLVNGRPVNGEFTYKNFDFPYIKTHFSTTQDLKSILELSAFDDYKIADGQVKIDFSIDGTLDNIKKKVVEHTHISGELHSHINKLVLKDGKSLDNTDIKLRMQDHDLIVDTLTGSFMHSDFNIKGKFKNFILYILEKDTKLDLEASLTSNFINVADFYDPSQSSGTESGSINIPNNMFVSFNSHIDKMMFNKLDFRNFKGELKIVPKKVEMRSVTTDLAGGKIKLNGEMSTLTQDRPRLDAHIELSKIYIDTVMSLFNDFDQTFITQNNLKGQLNTKMYINCSLDKKGNIDPSTIFSNIEVSISNGELVNFEPMQKLSKYVDEKELYNIKFSELKNTFHIENSIVYVPEMEIKSNLNTVSVMGSHKLSTEMDYKLKINLKRKKKDSDERFGAIKQDDNGNTQIFLTVKGTPENMKIAYDRDAVKDKIKDKWKEEKKEMKNLFKKEPPKEETIIELKSGGDEEFIDLN